MLTAEALAEWADALELRDFSAQAIELAKRSVLDALGCAFGTLSEECVSGIRTVLFEQGGAPQACVIGSSARLPVTSAALLNATYIRALDMNDHLAIDPNTGGKLGGHPSDMLGVILAVAEWKGAAGSDALAAMLVAYEVYGRAYAMLGADLPWDHATAFGIAAPVAAAKLLGLDARQTAHAIALSVSQAATLGGVRRGQLSHAKFLAGPWACQRGLMAALMASHGVTGPLSIFEDSRGVDAGILKGVSARDRLCAPLDQYAMIEGVTLKGYPGMDTTQAAEEAAVRVAAQLRGADRGGIMPGEIAQVELHVNDHPMTVAQTSDRARRSPASRETADHSFQFLVAVALLDGEVSPRQFGDERWLDPEVIRVMKLIATHPSRRLSKAYPGGFPSVLEVKLRDGRNASVEVGYAKGHARNPMSQAEVEEKFRCLTRGVLAAGKSTGLISAVRALEQLSDIAAITDLLSIEAN